MYLNLIIIIQSFYNYIILYYVLKYFNIFKKNFNIKKKMLCFLNFQVFNSYFKRELKYILLVENCFLLDFKHEMI